MVLISPPVAGCTGLDTGPAPAVVPVFPVKNWGAWFCEGDLDDSWAGISPSCVPVVKSCKGLKQSMYNIQSFSLDIYLLH